jgi:hypothetical protein
VSPRAPTTIADVSVTVTLKKEGDESDGLEAALGARVPQSPIPRLTRSSSRARRAPATATATPGAPKKNPPPRFYYRIKGGAVMPCTYDEAVRSKSSMWAPVPLFGVLEPSTMLDFAGTLPARLLNPVPGPCEFLGTARRTNRRPSSSSAPKAPAATIATADRATPAASYGPAAVAVAAAPEAKAAKAKRATKPKPKPKAAAKAQGKAKAKASAKSAASSGSAASRVRTTAKPKENVMRVLRAPTRWTHPSCRMSLSQLAGEIQKDQKQHYTPATPVTEADARFFLESLARVAKEDQY